MTDAQKPVKLEFVQTIPSVARGSQWDEVIAQLAKRPEVYAKVFSGTHEEALKTANSLRSAGRTKDAPLVVSVRDQDVYVMYSKEAKAKTARKKKAA